MIDVVFHDGHPYPNCDVHMDMSFPSYYAVQLMSGGSMYFCRGSGEVKEWNTPCFFWTDRRSHYRYGPGETGGWDHNWFSFSGEVADSYYKPLLERLAPAGIISVSNGAHLHSLFGQLFQSIYVPGDNMSRIHLFNRILAAVEENSSQGVIFDPKIKAIKDAIDSGPEQDYDFQRIAERYGFSYFNFRRLFRECTGAPPQRYLLARRMQKAARMLIQTHESAQAIGYHLGYDDPARFSKVFKQHHGKSPRAYRQAVLKW